MGSLFRGGFLLFEDTREEVKRKEMNANARAPWNRDWPAGQVSYQLPNGQIGLFDATVDEPPYGVTFIGRLRINEERSSNGKKGWSRRRLLAQLSSNLYQIDIDTEWERIIEWPDEDVVCIGVLIQKFSTYLI